MIWQQAIKEFESFLRLEKSLSANSIEAYSTDINKLVSFLKLKKLNSGPGDINREILREFIIWVHELGMSPRSQSRVISGIKAFYKFLLLTDQIDKDPSELLESPKIGRKLPEVLSIIEIDKMLAAIDQSKPEGRKKQGYAGNAL